MPRRLRPRGPARRPRTPSPRSQRRAAGQPAARFMSRPRSHLVRSPRPPVSSLWPRRLPPMARRSFRRRMPARARSLYATKRVSGAAVRRPLGRPRPQIQPSQRVPLRPFPPRHPPLAPAAAFRKTRRRSSPARLASARWRSSVSGRKPPIDHGGGGGWGCPSPSPSAPPQMALSSI